MNYTYRVTEELYIQLILFQYKNRNGIKKILFIAGNTLFLVIGIYLLLAKNAYSIWTRTAIALMLGITALTFVLRQKTVGLRARKAVEDLKEQQLLSADYFGIHTLIFNNENLQLSYNKSRSELNYTEVTGFVEQRDFYLIMHGKHIFEIIPKDAIQTEDVKGITEKIRTAKKRMKEQTVLELEKEFELPCAKKVYWEQSPEDCAKALAEGYRLYFLTTRAWLQGHQLIRTIILLYGMFMMIFNFGRVIGIIFVIIGLLLNRQFIMAFSPLAVAITKHRLEQKCADGNYDEKSCFLMQEGHMATYNAGEVQRAEIEKINNCRWGSRYAYLYTSNNQMLCIASRGFNEEDKIKLLEEINRG